VCSVRPISREVTGTISLLYPGKMAYKQRGVRVQRLLFSIVSFFIFYILTFATAFADQLTMKNGDRFTGTVVKTEGADLFFKSEYAGVIKIPFDAVVSITSSAPLSVGTKDGEVLVGTITTSDDKLEIMTTGTGRLLVPKSSVQFIRSKDEQASVEAQIERYRNPSLLDLWNGTVDLGYSLSKGNAETSTVSVSANAARTTKRDKISTYFTSLYASTDTDRVAITTANAIRGGVAYNLDISPKGFVFVSTDLEYDQFQNLDLRFAPAGGFGYHVIRTDPTILDLSGGASLNREFFSTGLKRTSGEILLGQELTHKFSKKTSVHQKLVIYPNVTSGGNYRINFDASAVTSFFKWLGWQFTVSDRFLSSPVAGRRQNDILFTTGFRIIFAR
jgi:hypothetical protein